TILLRLAGSIVDDCRYAAPGKLIAEILVGEGFPALVPVRARDPAWPRLELGQIELRAEEHDPFFSAAPCQPRQVLVFRSVQFRASDHRLGGFIFGPEEKPDVAVRAIGFQLVNVPRTQVEGERVGTLDVTRGRYQDAGAPLVTNLQCVPAGKYADL